MDLYDRAKTLGILTEYIDGQGHRRVTDAGALKIILDALPPQTPRRLVDQPVIVRASRPARRTRIGRSGLTFDTDLVSAVPPAAFAVMLRPPMHSSLPSL